MDKEKHIYLYFAKRKKKKTIKGLGHEIIVPDHNGGRRK
jgi:hypothetical protein